MSEWLKQKPHSPTYERKVGKLGIDRNVLVEDILNDEHGHVHTWASGSDCEKIRMGCSLNPGTSHSLQHPLKNDHNWKLFMDSFKNWQQQFETSFNKEHKRLTAITANLRSNITEHKGIGNKHPTKYPQNLNLDIHALFSKLTSTILSTIAQERKTAWNEKIEDLNEELQTLNWQLKAQSDLK